MSMSFSSHGRHRFAVLIAIACLISVAGPIVNLARAQAPRAEASPLNGFWLGTLQPPGGASLRIQITVTSDATGKPQCTVDSLDQNAVGLPCANLTFSPPDVSFDVPVVKGHWSGKLSEDRKWLI